MNVWFIVNFRAFIKALYVVFTALVVSSNCWAKDPLLAEINRLDQAFKTVSSNFYQDTSSYAPQANRQYKDISRLLKEVKRLSSLSDDINAIRTLYNNESIVMYNVDDKAVFTFLRILLRNNEWSMANKILEAVEDEGDKSLSATVHFIFAKYYAKRQQWDKVDELLENTITELSANDAAYAYLLKGVALQQLKRHRIALQYYNKIPTSSKFYPEAQLNIGTADIRLGWWTDADIIIKKLVQSNLISPENDLYNRLYLVLGYELLQKDYYRNARNAFRKVALNSRYANRALLGIGLTAISQRDYVGGVNALSILKKKQTMDLSVDESYLVLPFVYNKLQQELTVTDSYNEAIDYYKKRIRTLKQAAKLIYSFDSIKYDSNTKSLIINNNSFDYDSYYPASFFDNYRLLNKFSKNTKSKSHKAEIEKLLSDHNKVLQNIISFLLEQRILYLNSYLSQSRYGLAMLFDKSSNDMQKGQE